MIPILFDNIASNFESFGLGALAECISCVVTEERNGAYELSLEYPVSGRLYSELKTERLIKAKPNDTASDQFFRIYQIENNQSDIVTIRAQHISYDLAGTRVLPFEKNLISPALLLNQILDRTIFSGWTNYSDSKEFKVKTPKSARATLGGSEGSMLSKWKGEFEWDNFRVKLHRERGKDKGVTIRYGKNLTEFNQQKDTTELFSALLPFAVTQNESEEEKVITLPEITLPILGSILKREKLLIKDFSDQFEPDENITIDALRGVADTYLKENPLGILFPQVTIAFEPLWQNSDYPAVLEKVSLCDTVHIVHQKLGVTLESKVIKTVYDCLAEKYKSISLGRPSSNLLSTLTATEKKVEQTKEKLGRFPALLKSSIDNATKRITGSTGGHVVLHTDSSTGKPNELLILDKPSLEEAVRVWRWNLEGLGYSKNGYLGPYETAITADGEIVADFMTTGTLTANIIKAGVLASQDGSSYWDLESGEVVLKSYVTSGELDQVSMDIDGVRTSVEHVSEKSSELQVSVDGLNSYVSTLTGSVETVSQSLDEKAKRIESLQNQFSNLEHSVEGLALDVTSKYIGGVNFIQNSAGLNGITDDWQRSGVVRTSASTDVQNNTTSDSAFLLSENSTLTQTITGLVTGQSYSFSLRARKTSSGYTSYVRVRYNGDKYAYFFNTTSSFNWQDYRFSLDNIADSTIIIEIYNRSGQLYVSDLMMSEGSIARSWTPAPNEIYTNEVKIDKRGIEVTNNASSQRTVITNTEFAGYYNDEIIFTLNKDETQTKKTTVDGELTVGKTKFVPLENQAQGLNIVILD
jgi:phage minor structural protein